MISSNYLFFVYIDVDAALVRLLNIGIYLAFKNLLMEALNEVLEKRLPFLMFSADDFSKNFTDPKFKMLVNEMSSSCGFSSQIDSGLYAIIKGPSSSKYTNEHQFMLLLIFFIISIQF